MTNKWNVTFVCWILDQILRVTELGFDFGSGCEEPRTVEIFLEEKQQQALPSHLKTCVKADLRTIQLIRKNKATCTYDIIDECPEFLLV